MADILLINPSLQEANIGHYSRTIEKNRGVYPPLGLSYIASALRNAGHDVDIVDLDIDCLYPQKNYQWVGFYVMTWTYIQALSILKQLKEIYPDIKSILGGPHATCMPNMGEFDYVIPGEGEEAVVDLVDTLSLNHYPLQSNLDNISFPAWDLLKIDKYHDTFTRHQKFATMIASRGCPFTCIFCDRKNRMGSKWRVRSPENVINEIKMLREKYGIREIMFYDDNFVFDKQWIYKFCDLLDKDEVYIDWECRTRVDTVDLALLKRMRKSDCYRIRYGMESGNDGILKILKKGITVREIKDCVIATRKAGIEIFAYFMMGSPYESEKTLKDTLNLALWVNADFTVISKTILIVGSELFDWAVDNGYIAKDYWDKFIKEGGNPAPCLSTAILDEEEVDWFIKYSYKKLYLRPKYILKKLKSLRYPRQFLKQVKLGVSMLCG